MPVTITLVGPREVIEKLSQEQGLPDLDMDEPQPESSLADAVDSPIGPEEVKSFFELLTVAIGSATAGVVLLQKIKSLLKTSEKEHPHKAGKRHSTRHSVKLKNPINNKVLAEITEDTNVDDLAGDLFPELND
jgi:hypothetical protein